MPDFEQDVDDGFRSALTHWVSEMDVIVDDSQLAPLEEPRSLTLAVLGDYEARSGHVGRLGVTMFAEWVAMAAIVRIAHDEPPLQRDDLEAFLPAASGFLNTIFCGPPNSPPATVGSFWPSGGDVSRGGPAEAGDLETADLPEYETGGA